MTDEQIDTPLPISVVAFTLASRSRLGGVGSSQRRSIAWHRHGKAGGMNGGDPAARPDQPACPSVAAKGKEGPRRRRGKSERRRRVLIAPREKRACGGGGSTCQRSLMATPVICPPPHSARQGPAAAGIHLATKPMHFGIHIPSGCSSLRRRAPARVHSASLQAIFRKFHGVCGELDRDANAWAQQLSSPRLRHGDPRGTQGRPGVKGRAGRRPSRVKETDIIIGETASVQEGASANANNLGSCTASCKLQRRNADPMPTKFWLVVNPIIILGFRHRGPTPT